MVRHKNRSSVRRVARTGTIGKQSEVVRPEGKRETVFVDHEKYPFLFYIVWLDHCGSAEAGWEHLSHATDRIAETVWSVGWVMSEDETTINIIPSITQCGFTQGSMTILKSCIIEAKQLDCPKKWEVD